MIKNIIHVMITKSIAYQISCSYLNETKNLPGIQHQTAGGIYSKQEKSSRGEFIPMDNIEVNFYINKIWF